jgi:hypothetical protein
LRSAVLGLCTSALIAFGCLACSFVVDASDIDEQCPVNWKFCSGQCVEESDPDYGCGPTCGVICTLENATATCVEDECAVHTCTYGFAWSDINEGCLISYLADKNNCGSVGNRCAEGWICLEGQCRER